MTSFVGAEYVIATMLLRKAQKGVSYVSIDELGKYGISVQHMANSEDLDAVFLTSKYQLFNAIYDFALYGDLDALIISYGTPYRYHAKAPLDDWYIHFQS